MVFNGDKTRARREELGVSQAAFARAIGVHPVHMNRIEQGRVTPRTKTLLRIACALGCGMDDFIDRREGVWAFAGDK